MGLTVYNDLEQGSDEWLAARCGIITASVVGKLVSSRQPSAIETECPECGAVTSEPCIGKRSPAPIKTLHPARAESARGMDRVIGADLHSDTARDLINTLVAERITGHVEPIFPSRDMQRGNDDEPYARDIYSEHYAPASEVGFMVRDDWGYRMGYSPDGLVGDDGLIEIKSRKPKIQLVTVISDRVPESNMAQLQFGLLVSGRDWQDYVSYCGGMALFVKRVLPDPRWFTAILEATHAFEESAKVMIANYTERTAGLAPTERIDHYAEMSF